MFHLVPVATSIDIIFFMYLRGKRRSDQQPRVMLKDVINYEFAIKVIKYNTQVNSRTSDRITFDSLYVNVFLNQKLEVVTIDAIFDLRITVKLY